MPGSGRSFPFGLVEASLVSWFGSSDSPRRRLRLCRSSRHASHARAEPDLHLASPQIRTWESPTLRFETCRRTVDCVNPSSARSTRVWLSPSPGGPSVGHAEVRGGSGYPLRFGSRPPHGELALGPGRGCGPRTRSGASGRRGPRCRAAPFNRGVPFAGPRSEDPRAPPRLPRIGSLGSLRDPRSLSAPSTV